MNEWQPIETAPKDGTLILIFQPARNQFRKRIKAVYGSELMIRRPWGNDYPTHWMPYPDPPKD